MSPSQIAQSVVQTANTYSPTRRGAWFEGREALPLLRRHCPLVLVVGDGDSDAVLGHVVSLGDLCHRFAGVM